MNHDDLCELGRLFYLGDPYCHCGARAYAREPYDDEVPVAYPARYLVEVEEAL